EAGRAVAVGFRESLRPIVELLFRHVIGIETSLRWFRRHACDERLVVVEPRPRPSVVVKVVQTLAPYVRRIAFKVGFERRVAPPDLTQEDRLEVSGGGDDLIEGAAVCGREVRGIGRDDGWGEAANLGRQRLLGRRLTHLLAPSLCANRQYEARNHDEPDESRN